MLEDMRTVYEAELERDLRALTAEEAELISATLQKVTASTCEREAAATEAVPAVAAG
jgi:hypothetical protein